MSKAICCFVVIGVFCSLSQGGLYLTLDGEIAPEDFLVTPLDVYEIGVMSDSDITGFEFRIEVVDAGSLDSSNIVFPVDWMFEPYVIDSDDKYVDVTGGDFFSKTGPLVVLEGVLFQLDAMETTINLVATGDNILDGITYGAGTLFDTIGVTVVPEPVTLLLFAVGAMFLRRGR